MMKSLIAAAVASMAFAGVASAETVVQKHVEKTVVHNEHHDNGLHRGHAYGHRMHPRARHVEVREVRRVHRPMAHRHVVVREMHHRDMPRMHHERHEHHNGAVVKHVEKDIVKH